ncbi:MAG: sigma-70 family RNA polymerase sigma factor [Bacteroidota bacterium]
MVELEEAKTRTRTEQIEQWYLDLFPSVCGYIQKRGGDIELSKELFQEALVIYYEKHSIKGFLPEKKEAAYIMGIVKKLWLRHQSSLARMESVDEIELIEEHNRETQPIIDKLIRLLETSGRRCMDLLQSFYYDGLNMSELSKRFGYGSERSATVQKYKCLERVRDTVKQKSLGYEDFID